MKLFKTPVNFNFRLKHLLYILSIIILIQIAVFLILKYSFSSFLLNTQNWYQQITANRIANLSAISLETLVESAKNLREISAEDEKALISKLNIVFTQQLMEENVEDLCLFIFGNKEIMVIDNGRTLYDYFILKTFNDSVASSRHQIALSKFATIKNDIVKKEGIITSVENENIFHSFVPFVPDGEFIGVLYIRNRLNFSNITNMFTSNYDKITILLTILISIGLLVLYNITSYIIRVRDKAQKLYYEEHNRLVVERAEHDKEFIFTKRIYHANHKAEKIMGFIQQDILKLEGDNSIKNRVFKYANFISRVIYDMKWYDPPIHSIRNQFYNTNINEVINFIVKNIFERVAVKSTNYSIETNFDDRLPKLQINEFVIWEIIEPLVQNSLTHNNELVVVKISTIFYPELNKSEIIISDNGKGIEATLLEKDENGIEKIFLENTSTKNENVSNYGYGCFIAYNMAKKRCGWDLTAENIPQGGCKFTVIIKH